MDAVAPLVASVTKPYKEQNDLQRHPQDAAACWLSETPLMTLVRFLLGASRRMVGLIALVGIVNGFCSMGLVAIVNRTLNHREGVPTVLALAFLGLLLAKLGSSGIARVLQARFVEDTLRTVYERLCRGVATTPFRHLERIGIPRILTVLTADVPTLGVVVQSFPSLLINGAVLVACGAYLTWLSWTTFLGMLGLVFVGAAIYRLFQARAQQEIRLARSTRDTLFRHFRALTEGVKELRLHRKRRDVFFVRDIAGTTDELRRHNLVANKWYIVADMCSNAFFYVMIGLLLFALPLVDQLPFESLTGYIFVSLYLMNPLWAIIGTVPFFNRGQIALQKIEECKLSLAPPADRADLEFCSNESTCKWADLDMRGVVFAYEPEEPGNGAFRLGPIDFALHPRDLVFVVGGNGSGKSTFVKLLTGLYSPHAGEIRLDGQLISEENRDWYRQFFSAVFSDFYLFDDLLGLSAPDLDARAREYLARLQLDGKIELARGRFSSTALSQGQRKRLALLTAYLEDRPIYVFDEWAADQDPSYKEIFYRHLLPELRNRGKAVVVITHDDRYFHLGDRVIKLDYGKLVSA
jgi:putative pyoverdin transport system ATP-binding/permease protein